MTNYYAAHREERIEYQRRYYARHREAIKEKVQNWYSKNPEKYYAEYLARLRVPLGPKCENPSCNATSQLERHHPDYSKPLTFQTMCKSCHKQLHGKLRRKKD